MKILTLSGHVDDNANEPDRIFCPALAGLTAEQADLAFVMPRLDHNRVVQEEDAQGNWAALVASDPFGSETAKFARLYDLGYRGITNWPSSILIDGSLRDAMLSVPASAEFEYDFLARAQDNGFATLAFFLSLGQARAALKVGLHQLVLHPGLLEAETRESNSMVFRSLERLIDAVRSEAEDVSIYVYSSEWHEKRIPLSTLNVDGVVWFARSP